jgi:hypothetical protein
VLSRKLLHQPIAAQLAYLHWSSGHDFRLSRVISRQARETRVRFPDGEHLFLFWYDRHVSSGTSVLLINRAIEIGFVSVSVGSTAILPWVERIYLRERDKCSS